MELALALLTLINSAAPGIAQLILLIKRNDGSVSVVTLLDEADEQFDKNIKQAGDWLKAHPQVQP
jgi:hypothetical protein